MELTVLEARGQSVRALKRQLQGLCGLPRFRQRLLLEGAEMPGCTVVTVLICHGYMSLL